MTINRRRFLQGMAMAGGGLLFMPACRPEVSFRRVLTEEEARLLIAITEQIIPADEDPGATDAGVVNFIDKQLAGFYADLQLAYQSGLAAFQESCRQITGKNFEDLDWDNQTKILMELEANRLDHLYWKDNPGSQFFNLVRNHTMQGFYGSPRHGGNKNYVSYKMMRLDYPHILGRNIYTPQSETFNAYKL